MPRRLPLALALTAAWVGGTPFAHATVEQPVTANLDADPALERLVPEPVEDRFGFVQRRVLLEDDCGPRSYRLMGPHDTIETLRVLEADGDDGRPEVLVEGRSGASGRAGTTRIARAGAPCAPPRILFSYSSLDPRPKPPRGTYVTGYGVSVRDYSSDHRGREIRLQESLVRNGEPPLAASRRRLSYWRYSRAGDRWVRYRSRVTRLG
jgi:hypothetical protein